MALSSHIIGYIPNALRGFYAKQENSAWVAVEQTLFSYSEGQLDFRTKQYVYYLHFPDKEKPSVISAGGSLFAIAFPVRAG